MAESAKGQGNAFFGILFAATVILILAGLLIQLFIVVVNVFSWMKRGSLKPGDQIITSLAITKVLYHTASLLEVFSRPYFGKLIVQYLILIKFTVQTLVISTIWLSTLLSIFFSFKISNFHNVFFLRLKAIISERVVYLIIASVVLTLGMSMTCLLLTFNIFSRNSTTGFLLNYDKSNVCDIFWNIFPLYMYFFASIFLIISLSFHIWRMKHCGNAISSTDTYHRIIKFTAISFLVCAVQITLNLTKQYGFRFFGVFWMIFIWNMFPILHSMSLIYINTRLRDAFFKCVYCGSSCLFKRNG
uniref:Taste receptor type 2 n=1 Tax=Pyxicephalus adspersus TaxID=30357 RepID=A0AAV3A882_PYXAD|nr:TPA: hypothetical protein GDO54_009876 [Pyxicephalus adspersus]